MTFLPGQRVGINKAHSLGGSFIAFTEREGASKFYFGKSFSKPFPIFQFLQLPELISIVNTSICSEQT